MKLVELVMLARVMSQRYGVNVQISQNISAFCSVTKTAAGEREFTISLPALEDQGKYDRMVRGYLDHELAHVKYTDWNISDTLAKRSPKYFTNYFKSLWNIFEDVYVEEKMSKNYPGCKVNLRWLARQLFTPQAVCNKLAFLIDFRLDWQSEGEPTVQDPLCDFVLVYILHKRRAMADPELAHSHVVLDKAKALFFSLDKNLVKVFARIDDLLMQPANSTQETYDLAKAVYDLLAARNIGVLEGRASQQTDEFREFLNKTSTGLEPGSAGGTDVAAAFNAHLASLAAEVSADCTVAAKGALAESSNMRCNRPPTDVHAFAHMPNQFQAEIAVLRSAFARTIPGLLQSVQYKPCRTGYTGRLDGRNLYRAGVGDGRLFLHKAERREQRVDVGLLLDASGSMCRQIIPTQICLYAMLGMLKMLPKVRSCAAVFQGLRYSWLNCMDDRTIKNYQLVVADGGTPTAGAVLQMLPALSTAQDVRRILFIITDGDPDNCDAFVMALQVAKAQGVEVYGIALYHMGAMMKSHFGAENMVEARSISELPEKLSSMMKAALVRAVA